MYLPIARRFCIPCWCQSVSCVTSPVYVSPCPGLPALLMSVRVLGYQSCLCQSVSWVTSPVDVSPCPGLPALFMSVRVLCPVDVSPCPVSPALLMSVRVLGYQPSRRDFSISRSSVNFYAPPFCFIIRRLIPLIWSQLMYVLRWRSYIHASSLVMEGLRNVSSKRSHDASDCLRIF
jgi:hypothetical protein